MNSETKTRSRGMRRAQHSPKALSILRTLLLAMLGLIIFPQVELRADDRNFDIGPGGSPGIPTAWDSESINALDGNVHLEIPLYSVASSDTFGMDIALRYDSKVWDASDLNYSTDPTHPTQRNLIAKGVFGLGWKLNFGRVYTISYTAGSSSELYTYFQSPGGDSHRLFKTAPIRLHPWGTEFCAWNEDPYFYAYDGSGIRASFNAPISEWTVWLPDGTKFILPRAMVNDVNTPEQMNYSGWYTTTIESAVRKGDGNPYRLTISYISPSDTARRYCPDRVIDDFGREVVFNCQATTSGGIPVDGGVVNAITVPAPHGQTLTYQLNYAVSEIFDPFQCPTGGLPCTSRAGVLLLSSIVAQGVSPAHTFQFDYTAPVPSELNRTNFGELNKVVLPNGGQRIYVHGEYRMWRKDYPIIFTGASTEQFKYFPHRGVTSRRLKVDGKTWQWDYVRENASGCTELTPTACYNHPITVRQTGPYDPSDTSIGPSSTVQTFHGTLASGGTPAERALDGLLATVSVYAGSPDPTRLLRTTSMTYGYDLPVPDEANTCYWNGFLRFFKNHYVDHLRTTRIATSIDDDAQPPIDQRVVEHDQWTMVTNHYGRFLERREYGADGTTLYRKNLLAFALTANQRDAWILTPISSTRDQSGSGVTLRETDFAFDDYGRITSQRHLFAPGASPGVTSNRDVLREYEYDVNTGNLKKVSVSIPLTPFLDQQGVFRKHTDAWTGGYATRQHMDGMSWNSMDVDRDVNTGLPTSIRGPSGTGVSVSYDLLGRQIMIRPLANSPDPPVDIIYELSQGDSSFQVTRVIGDAQSATSFQSRVVLDGLGRVREARSLKSNDQGSAEWVAKRFTRDALGNLLTQTEWAPVGATGPTTTIVRAGAYDATANVYWDPFMRVRKVLGPENGTTLKDYLGLITTTTIQGIQGGSTATPTSINSVTMETGDILGRLVTTTTRAQGAANPDRLVDFIYDELDRTRESRTTQVPVPGGQTAVVQVRSLQYDPLGRVTRMSEPERGTIWFGTVTGMGAGVDSDGYDPLGNVIRYEEANGFGSLPSFHYRISHDAAGRRTMVEKEEDASGVRTRIADYSYDDPGHGIPSGQALDKQSQYGHMSSMRSYDEFGNLASPIARSDYFFKGQFGRFNKVTTSLAGLSAAYSTYYSYNAMGQVSHVVYPTTGVEDPQTGLPSCTNWTCLDVDWTRGFVTHISSSRGYAVVDSALYNDAGLLKQWIAGTGTMTQIIPDSSIKSRPNEIKVKAASGTQLWSSGMFSYDGAGLIKGMGSDVYTYDAIGRIKEAQVTGVSGGTIYNQAFTYDSFNNILSRTDTITDPINPQSPTTINYTVQATSNRVLGIGGASTWTYRQDGALAHDDAFDYGYDNAGRLSLVRSGSVDRGSYAYDAFGLRIYRKEANGKEVYYFRDADGDVLSQVSRPVNVTALEPQWDRDFVYFDGKRVNMVEEPLPLAPAWLSSQTIYDPNTQSWKNRLQLYPNADGHTHGYLVYKKTAPGSQFVPLFSGGAATSTTTTSYDDTLLPLGTGCTYKVVAVDYAGNHGPESGERFITAGDSTPTAAPTNLSATPGNARVTLTWVGPSSAVDLAGYFVYRKLASGSYGSPLNAIALPVANYTDLAVVNGTTYYYVVKAVDTAGNLSAQSSQVSAKPSALLQGFNLLIPSSEGGVLVADGAIDGRKANDGLEAAPYAIIGQVAGANSYFLHSDHLGGLRLVTNSLGAIVTAHKYLPYGVEIQAMNSLNPYRYAGYERDSESGMDYVRARYYRPSQTRWLTPDPLGDGYGYAANTPMNAYDPSGLRWILQPTCPQGVPSSMCEPLASGGWLVWIPDSQDRSERDPIEKVRVIGEYITADPWPQGAEFADPWGTSGLDIDRILATADRHGQRSGPGLNQNTPNSDSTFGLTWYAPYDESTAKAVYGDGKWMGVSLAGISGEFGDSTWSGCVRGCLYEHWNPGAGQYMNPGQFGPWFGGAYAHATCYARCDMEIGFRHGGW